MQNLLDVRCCRNYSGRKEAAAICKTTAHAGETSLSASDCSVAIVSCTSSGGKLLESRHTGPGQIREPGKTEDAEPHLDVWGGVGVEG